MKNKLEEIWIIKYNIAAAYYEHNGNLEIPQKFKTLNGYEYDENGISLGTWLATQRQSYKKEKLSPERINLLKAIGMRLEIKYNDGWNKNYALVQNYYEHHGNLEIPVKFKTLNGYEYDENGINLGIWIRKQRQLYKKAKLSPERINLLKNIGMCLETRDNNNEWNKNYALAKNYYERNGNLEIPVRFKTLNGYEYDENGINLGIWIISQRRSYKNVKLSPEKINLLKTIGMRFEIKYNDGWNKNYALAKNYYEHNGNLEIPEKFKTLNGYEHDENGINLGMWFHNQRQLYKKARLSPERLNLLKDIGMCFETRDNNNEWNKNYTLAKNYYEHNGNLEIPEKFKTLNGYEHDENGINLGMWIRSQRRSYKNVKLSPERLNLLKDIGMRFEIKHNNNEWNKNYALAKNYYERNGNLEIPSKFKTLDGYEYDENGINLRRWLAVQTQLYQKARLSPERLNLLKDIGMCFETRDNNNEWNKNYTLAKNYYEHNGNLEIPEKFKTLNGYEHDENGINLGMWIRSQRRSYKNVKLSPERLNLLKDIGMRFEIKHNNNEWNKNYALAKNYYEHNGNLEIPEKFKTLNGYEYDENGINLRRWLAVQTQLYQKARLSTERINLLENIGIKWFAYNNINYTEENVIFDSNTQRLIKLKILNSFKLYLNSLDQNALPSKAEINQDFLDVLNYTHKKK